jgi:hypothetical protein
MMGLGSSLGSTSVADPGFFIPDSDPDPTIAPFRIPDPGGKKAPDVGSDLFLYKAINKFCLLIPDPDPTIAPSRIPDPGGKKAPDPDPQHWAPQLVLKYSCNTNALV